MLNKRKTADLSRYEILGILLEKGLSVREIAATCRLSQSTTWGWLQRLGYEHCSEWRKVRGGRKAGRPAGAGGRSQGGRRADKLSRATLADWT